MGVMGIEQKPWSYADDAKLRELWETTPSSKLAAIFGRSRNAVIGRAHRMKLPPKRFRSGNKTKSAPKRAVTQKLRTSGVTNQRPTSLSDRNVGAIHVRSPLSSHAVAADAGEGSPAQRPQPSPVALPLTLRVYEKRIPNRAALGDGVIFENKGWKTVSLPYVSILGDTETPIGVVTA